MTLSLLMTLPAAANEWKVPAPVRELHYREVLFHHYQQEHFHALTTLLAGQERARVDRDSIDAGLLRIGIELSFGMHEGAGAGFGEWLEQRVSPQARDRVWLSLARTWSRRGYPERVSAALERIGDGADFAIAAEKALLGAHSAITRGDHQAALALLGTVPDAPLWSAYAAYNRWMLIGDPGTDILSEGAPAEAKREKNADAELRSLRDHLHVAVGQRHLANGRLPEAAAAFARVEAGSLVAGQARLGEGQVAMEMGDSVRADRLWAGVVDGLEPGPLAREVWLLRATAQRRSGSREEAAALYREAIAGLERESGEIARLIVETGTGRMPAASTPYPPSPYLHALVGNDAFHEAWQAWHRLQSLEERLATWRADIVAFEAMLATRREGYARRLPEVEERLAGLDIDALKARIGDHAARVTDIDAREDALALADAGEQQALAMIADIEARLARHAGNDRFDEQRERLRVLKGVLIWNLAHDFRARLWQIRKEVMKLEGLVGRVEEGRSRLVQAQEAAPARFSGFDHRLANAGVRIDALRERLTGLAARHEAYLRGLVVAELERQRGLTTEAMARARYEFATLLDEMAVATADGDWRQALEAWLEFSEMTTGDARQSHALRRIADMRLMLADAMTVGYPDRDSELRAAVDIYEGLLSGCVLCPGNDGIHYQRARAFDALDEPGHSLDALSRIIEDHPRSALRDEAWFRRGEILFVQRSYEEAAQAYAAVIAGGSTTYSLQARYKHGWSLFKMTRYEESVDDFIAVLDRHLLADAGDGIIEPEALPDAGRALVTDTLRVIALAFSHLDGPEAASAWFASRPPVAYEHLVFTGLAEHYLEKERYNDAARTLEAFIVRNSLHAQAVASQIRIIDIHEQAGFHEPARVARRQLLERFGVASAYWQANDIKLMPEVGERLRHELLAMAERAHAGAQAARTADAYREAAHWYRDYLAWFPADVHAPRLSFLLGELLFETGEYAEAVAHYEQSAYHLAPHEQASEAGYAALLAYERLIAGAVDAPQKSAWQEQAIVSALLFADQFPVHNETPAVLMRAAEQLHRQGHGGDALVVARRVVTPGGAAAPALRLSAWTLIGQIQFDDSVYDGAEQAFARAVSLLEANDPSRAGHVERYAAAIYQQGQLARDRGESLVAAGHFQRVGQLAPGSSIVETAEYDAASALLAGGNRAEAVRVLERFRSDWPDSRWADDVTRKLYIAYRDDGRYALAASELVRLEAGSDDPEEARAAVWESAELYERAGMSQESLQRYRHYVSRWPGPLDPAIEARRRIAGAYLAQGNDERHRHWLNEIVTADADAAGARTDFSRQSAAEAVLALAEPLRRQFEAVRLVIPLERSLKSKRAAMEKALQAYRLAADYGVADVTTAATFHIGEIYHELSRALLTSQRPAELSAEELEQYDILLEEQAYPFEEEAISLHEVNYRRIADGIYDDWVKRSMEQLATLLPARYGKAEILVSVVETIH